MSQNKQEHDSIQLNEMLYYQNLVPGQQKSPLIDDFRSECLEQEKDELIKKHRAGLLMEFPPILSFSNAQEKNKFYEKEAQNNQQFCCGGMAPISVSFVNGTAFSAKDDYMFCSGSGQIYEGSKKTIDEEIKEDICQEPFGSPSQEALMDGLKIFDNAVAQRNQSSITIAEESPVLTEMKSPTTPFDTTLKRKE
ncbi:hypothetical protein OQJ15_04800 [Fluoribacter dumoffii]|uniref:Uncharacterized protein n=1 Tax=Fluoribacter dumoffii TaxID=463 RepID=A0A377G9D7_9GAMM|nr:hypothetical protein [Fluoribacter dumoffii]KTC90305.1 hypothetical protein Ldum_1373 [Fluoribacter dumoffii NY 23]MCW8385623.1 hypothetical protein [Fluoribacter dumoffii]MCW8496082.1 hypothetical protein [Fluoribacter dumoffii]STO21425.1 Uncharacterised protein [Fluoribacter dumoffii]